MHVSCRNVVLILLMVLLLLPVVGCKKEPPPPPPPPEPTPEEIKAKIKSAINAIPNALNTGALLTAGQGTQAVGALRQKKAQHSGTENGRKALEMIKTDIPGIIRKARDSERWDVVGPAIELFKVMDPGATRFDTLAERARLMLIRPVVSIKGFVETNGELYAFLEIYDVEKQKSFTYQVREGEEIHGVLRMVRIIGDREKIEMLYIPVNDVWEVLGPKK